MEGSKTDIGANVRYFRKVRRISQSALAERAEITRATLARIESGDVSPKMSTLQRVANVLDLSLQDIVSPPRQLKHVRFRADESFDDRDSVLTDAVIWLENYRLVERCAEERELVPVRRNVVKEIRASVAETGISEPAMRARKAAQTAREKANLGKKETVRDICGLLSERLGVKIYHRPFNTLGFFGLCIKEDDGGPAVIVNTWERITVERWVFTAIHELGHLVLHENSFDVAQRSESNEEEREATIFAAYFLMPDEVFREEWEDSEGLPFLDRVFKLKRIFKVSYRTVLHRLEEQSYIEGNPFDKYDERYYNRFGIRPLRTVEHEPMSKRWFVEGAPEVRRAREKDPLADIDFVEDRLARLVRICLREGEITVGKAASVLNISLAEMRDRALEWGVYSPAMP